MVDKLLPQGTPEEVMKDENSLTGQYLSQERNLFHLPIERRKGDGTLIED